MFELQDDTIIVDQETSRLEAFRLEDTTRAPAIILFIDEDEPQMVPLDPNKPIPVRVKSRNSETEIQVISYEEIKATLAAR
ncbi:hypothetical protein [Desulfogranum mediterraneum]|uniref:hypothetical protein n=1 Tax=Desulfogranum mediterraneum TaxID=160661 RepID=UPI000400CAE6|nr:hypothetical protein [Desulfogranum mediterraneum]